MPRPRGSSSAPSAGAAAPSGGRPRRPTLRDRTIRLIALSSGNVCAFPGCAQALALPATATGPAVVVGEIAHIHGESPGGPRFDPRLSAAERNAPENLIYLCPVHHGIVDGRVDEYPAPRLRQMKADHEAALDRRRRIAAADVSFSELEVICRFVMRGVPAGGETPLTVLTLEEKLAINRLTSRPAMLLTAGLASAPVVADYLARMDSIDSGFPERLRAGFVAAYRGFVAEGLEGDVLFATLVDFAAQECADLARQVAGLSVLTHLFEACDVFETDAERARHARAAGSATDDGAR